jgi:hypothetical protein
MLLPAAMGEHMGEQQIEPATASTPIPAAARKSRATRRSRGFQRGFDWQPWGIFGFPQPRHVRRKTYSREAELKLELQRELHRTWPPNLEQARTPVAAEIPKPSTEPTPKPSTEPKRALATTAIASHEVDEELQRELRRMPALEPLSEELLCAQRLAKVAHYTPVPSRDGPGECGGIDLVQIDKVMMSDKSTVALKPAPTLRCAMAEQLAGFVRDDLGPAAADLGSPLMAISDLDSYQCRPRNNVKGAKLSEHGKGNAIDINIVRLRNGGVFNLTDRLVSKPFRERLRAAACHRFSTVLGPGSDSYHSDHIHLDIAERSHHYQICQWNVLEPVTASEAPLPARKPSALKGADAKAQALKSQVAKTRSAKTQSTETQRLPAAQTKTAPGQAQRRVHLKDSRSVQP